MADDIQPNAAAPVVCTWCSAPLPTPEPDHCPSCGAILTGELDLFRDENILFAMRLMAAEVTTQLYVYPGAPHGFERIAPAAAISRQFFADRDAILSRVFATQTKG